MLLYAASPQFYFLEAQFSHQAVAAHPPAVGVLLIHRPPCPPPSRVPSPGYAFPQPLTRVTIVI